MAPFNVSHWGVRSSINVHSSDNTVEFYDKNQSTCNLRQIVEEVVPDKSTYITSPIGFNGSLQTILPKLKSFDTPEKQVYFGRRVFKFQDGGIASLDYVLANQPKTPEEIENFRKLREINSKSNWPKQYKNIRFFSEEELQSLTTFGLGDDSEMAIIFHGIGGSSNEALVRDLIFNLRKHSKVQHILAVNSRGCGRTGLTTPKISCGVSTGDMREVIHEINELFPKRKIFLLGYSFGSLTMLNYVYEESIHNRKNNIQLAISISAPWDVVQTARKMKSSYSGKYLFNRAIAKYEALIVKNNLPILEKLVDENPDLAPAFAKLDQYKDTAEVHHEITCRLYGFNNYCEYYRKISPVNHVHDFKIPIISINSNDDPCVNTDFPTFEFRLNPYTLFIETNMGGHLAFVDWKGESWCNRTASLIINNYIKKVDMDKRINDHGYRIKRNVYNL